MTHEKPAYWPRFSGEGLFESLINHYAFDIVEEQLFDSWLYTEKGVEDPDEIDDPEQLLIWFREWAALEPEWVGAFSAHREFGDET